MCKSIIFKRGYKFFFFSPFVLLYFCFKNYYVLYTKNNCVNLESWSCPTTGRATICHGASMENSGIDDTWIEADVYGSARTRQILKCTHYKRALRANIYSYVAILLWNGTGGVLQRQPTNARGLSEGNRRSWSCLCWGKKHIKAETVKRENNRPTWGLDLGWCHDSIVKTVYGWI